MPDLPDAVAPNITITGAADIDEDETSTLAAALSGGTYDAVDSAAWSVVSGGGSFTGNIYDPADVAADTQVTVRRTVTVSGDGTNAADGTTAIATEDATFTVRRPTSQPSCSPTGSYRRGRIPYSPR